MLPKFLIKRILIFRAHAWLTQLCKDFSINESELRNFLNNNGAVCFGSFITSCLLNSNGFNDIDIMTPDKKLNNYQVRQSIKKIASTTSDDSLIMDQKHLYCPREICSDCAKFNEDQELFTYHRIHHITPELSFDIIETKDIQQHLTNSTFDTGVIYFDGINFHLGNIDLLSFVLSPSFKIISLTKGINFEFFYDPWCAFCREFDHKNARYEFADESEYKRQYPKITSQLKNIQSLWKDELNCFSWMNFDSLNLPILEFMKLCFSHFRRDKMTNITTFYKITRVTLRILKNCFRGMKCKNVDEFYS